MKFTIEQIKVYLNSQDSLGDIHYNLSEENITKVNNPECDNCGDPIKVDREHDYCGVCKEFCC